MTNHMTHFTYCRLCLHRGGPTGKLGFLRIHKSDLSKDQREGIFKVVDWTGWEFSKGTFVDYWSLWPVQWTNHKISVYYIRPPSRTIPKDFNFYQS